MSKNCNIERIFERISHSKCLSIVMWNELRHHRGYSLIEVFTERPALFAQKLSRSSMVTYFCDSTDILHLLDIKKIRNLRFLGDLHGHESTYGLF
jgi:hypothetical protein